MSIVLPPDHAAWLKERRFGIGASDAASILGMSKWKSNEELWEEKVGIRQPEDISDKPYVQFGHDAEPHIRALFALDHPEFRVTYESPFKIIRNDEYPFIFCTPDGELEELATGRHGGFECKTTEIMSPAQWNDWKDRIPDQYYAQVCHQMLAADWEFVILKARIRWRTRDGEWRIDARHYTIEREEVLDDIAELKKAEIRFWHHVQAKKRPALKMPMI